SPRFPSARERHAPTRRGSRVPSNGRPCGHHRRFCDTRIHVGLFELQRELHAESARKQKTAKTKARALDASTLIDDAWAMDLDPKVSEPMYRKVAAKDDAVGLAVARLDKSRPESNRALFEENIEIIAPVLAARLRTDRAVHAAQLLAQAGPRA